MPLVRAVQDCFDGIHYRVKGEKFLIKGPIPKGISDVIIPADQPWQDSDVVAGTHPDAPRADKSNPHNAPAPPWTGPGHPSVIEGAGGEEEAVSIGGDAPAAQQGLPADAAAIPPPAAAESGGETKTE